MTGRVRNSLVAAGLLGLTGVGLGAMGAHALAETLAARGMAHAWETGARYHIVHAVALLAIAAWLRLTDGRAASRLQWAGRCLTLGTILFSGSLYWLALGAPRWAGPITPVGGLALMAGWVLIIAAAFSPEK